MMSASHVNNGYYWPFGALWLVSEMSNWSALSYVGPILAVNAAMAAYAWVRPEKVAHKNRAFVESGKEAYFEQRRAWKVYGTTLETDPGRLRRHAPKIIAVNLLMLAILAGMAAMS